MKVKVLEEKTDRTVSDVNTGDLFTPKQKKNLIAIDLENEIWMALDVMGSESGTTVAVNITSGYTNDFDDDQPILEVEVVEMVVRIKE